jgi:sterol desaturase/sphingolipid hydroxylase (fatty acid hydroxylase superfamily)
MILGFLVYFLAMDLGEYLFHRAEHAVPALWAMHSLHHSDSRFDASTSVLHYWGAPLVHSIIVAAPMGLLFKAPPIDLVLWVLAANHVFLMHANLKWDFGRFWWLVTSPVYHRTHHSALPEHFDCNYASILPVWDILFRTRRPVSREAIPPVGLGEGVEAKSLADLVLWPLRLRAPADDAANVAG